ncbi:MAG: MFS transporter [Variibacter sp.]|nr:MFS transporter [Variibacter sp.]
MLAPFGVRSFCFQWPGDLLTSWAFEMETLILGWYVLVETGSVLALTVFGALQYLGTLIAPMVGVVGDRIGHRTLLCGMRAIYAALAALLMTLAFMGVLTPMLVLLIAAICGLVRPSDQGMRAALVAETMPPAQLMGAMSISRTTSDTARIAGALVGAGMFAKWGIGPAYVAVTAFYLLGLAFTLGVAARPARPLAAAGVLQPRRSSWSDLREGIVYVWRTPGILGAMGFAFFGNLVAFPVCNGLIPYVAKDVYGTDQTGLGYLAASYAAGALIGSLALSAMSHRIRPGRMLIVFAGAWYASVLLFSQMQTIGAGAAALAVAGLMQSFTMVPLTVILLRMSGEAFRGRIMGVRMLVIYGLPLGLLASGALIDLIGFRATGSLYAAIGLTFTLIGAFWWRNALWSAEADANAR